ncbi:CYTH domain-containing protein [Dongshaea marina]|uniref:CYTH domain-containing protein n=1 Tax=Dongshaea marina TaxID=2047966 RepID=UPI000D3E15E6|nr:CYTH domain-containing protein [Dongshaea marina]
MTKEIEIKFLLQNQSDKKIKQLLSGLDLLGERQFHLKNSYFDTPARQLWQWRLGLRVRQDGGYLEQTIKTSGRVIGGLHQRSEYNIKLEEPWPWPRLSDFPKEIWPKEAGLPQIQQELTKLFTTDFERTLWKLGWDQKSEVEVVLDRGAIVATELHEPIHELELELLKGRGEALFALSRKLIHEVDGLRFGLASKAQRGFALAEGAPLGCKTLTTERLSTEQLIGSGLEHWLYHQEIYWQQGDDRARSELILGIKAVSQGLRQLGGLEPLAWQLILKQLLEELEANTSREETLVALGERELLLTTLGLMEHLVHKAQES